jgi:hypothetical protein
MDESASQRLMNLRSRQAPASATLLEITRTCDAGSPAEREAFGDHVGNGSTTPLGGIDVHATAPAGEPFTDHPLSVCPVIASFLRTYNDSIDSERRQGEPSLAGS